MRLTVLLLLSALLQCAGAQHPHTPPENALIAIHSVAHGLSLADGIVSTRCGVASPAPECQRYVEAYGVIRASLIAGEGAAREWQRIGDATSQCRLNTALKDVNRDVAVMFAVLAALNVSVPPEAQTGVTSIASIVSANVPVCGG